MRKACLSKKKRKLKKSRPHRLKVNFLIIPPIMQKLEVNALIIVIKTGGNITNAAIMTKSWSIEKDAESTEENAESIVTNAVNI